MPKITEFPKFRARRRGRIVCYYYDMRSAGVPDVPLGTDRDVALDLWRRIAAGAPVEQFRRKPKVAKPAPIPHSKRLQRDPGRWGDMPNWARQAYMNAERRSRVRGRSEFMSIEQLQSVIDRAAGCCEVTGIPFDEAGAGRRPFTPSLDRIDASLGYVAGNVRVVCLIVNQAMSEWGEAPLLLVAEHMMQKRLQKIGEVSSRPTRLSA